MESAYGGSNTIPAGYRAVRGGNYPLNTSAMQSSCRINMPPVYPNQLVFHFAFRVARILP